MDKTAWIVVCACLGLLGFNLFYNQEDKPNSTPPPAASSTATPTAATAAATSPASAATAAPTANAPEQGAVSNSGAADITRVVSAVPKTAVSEIASLSTVDSKGQPVARFSFQNVGGSLANVEMLGKALNSTKPEFKDNVKLNSGASHGIGTLMFDLSESQAPRFDTTVYELVESTKESVTLRGEVGPLLIYKTYRLKPLRPSQDDDSIDGLAYSLSMELLVRNNSAEEREALHWGLYTGVSAPISPAETANYTYYVTFEDGDFEKENVGSFQPWFSEDKDRVYQTEHEHLAWAGSMNQYYATVVIPQGNAQTQSIYAAPTKVKLPVTGESADAVELALGIPSFRLTAQRPDMQSVPVSFSYEIFTGPKLNLVLGEMSDNIKEYNGIHHIMDYGLLSILSYPMNWLINIFHGWFGNWGWAIVAMTIVVRLLIWPLYRKSYMSMKRMSLLQPMMKELKEKHPDDPQKVNMEMMRLYKEYGISPVGGCLPMLLQIPIFFAFFFVLQTCAEFRGAPFMGWITDLSQMDTVYTLTVASWNIPINVLPFIMVITMILQMRMTPQAGDATQQMIMKLMPLMFFVFCYTYPSALALYWTTQNIISIGQTWLIQRVPIPELTKAARKPGKKGFFERMLEAQQAALAEQQKKAGANGEKMRNVTKKD